MITLGGDPAKTYPITLHVQGEVDRRFTTRMDQDPPCRSSIQPWMAFTWVVGRRRATTTNVYMVLVSEPSKDYLLSQLDQAACITDHTTLPDGLPEKIQAKGGCHASPGRCGHQTAP